MGLFDTDDNINKLNKIKIWNKMKQYILLLWVVFFPILLVAQTTQFSQKEQDKILKLYTKTFKNNETILENIGNELVDIMETTGMIVEKDLAEHLSIDSILIDSIKIIDDASPIVVLTYNSDNQSYTINLNEEENNSYPAMHFANTIYYGGGIESVVKRLLFASSFSVQDALYDIEYELILQGDSLVISNRYIQKKP